MWQKLIIDIVIFTKEGKFMGKYVSKLQTNKYV